MISKDRTSAYRPEAYRRRVISRLRILVLGVTITGGGIAMLSLAACEADPEKKARPHLGWIMNLQRRELLCLAAGAAVFPAASRIAWAQAYPTRPVRIIVGFAAGGPGEMTARLAGHWLSERLGQPFIVEFRPGAGTNIGTEFVVRAPPDGYTLLLAVPANAINATLYEKLSFNFLRDMEPVAGILREPLVVVVSPSAPVTTVVASENFIRLTRSHRRIRT